MKSILVGQQTGRKTTFFPFSTIISLALVILPVGCTHFARKRATAQAALEEHSRALTTAVVDSLELQPAEQREPCAEFALKVAREEQRIQGFPLHPITVEPLIQTNEPQVRALAERGLETRFREIEKLLATERKESERLIQFGEAHEAMQNRTRARWARWLGSSGLVVGGVIAVCVFAPALIPVFGRILAWVVSKIPALAGAVGVVSVKAFDAVVKGIEKSKSTPESSKPTRLPNEFSPTSVAGASLDQLHLNLSREMDADHKELVRARRASLLTPATNGGAL